MSLKRINSKNTIRTRPKPLTIIISCIFTVFTVFSNPVFTQCYHIVRNTYLFPINAFFYSTIILCSKQDIILIMLPALLNHFLENFLLIENKKLTTGMMPIVIFLFYSPRYSNSIILQIPFEYVSSRAIPSFHS